LSSIVSSITGTSSGQGADFKAKEAQLLNPTTVDQANQQYGNLNQGIANQNAFLQALQAQNGIQNQSNVFNQLQNVASGTGPNPAQAQLAQATGANTANQAALMAGQRGTGANAGLLARQAAMQGGANQQQAAGQAATMQANQSLAALNQLGGLANQQVAQQGAATGALTQAGQNAYGQVSGNINAQNQANLGNVEQQNRFNQAQAGQQLGMQADIFKGVMTGAGQASGLIPPGSKPMAEGGPVTPMSHYGKMLHGKVAMAQGGKVPALVSPGEKYIAPEQIKDIKQGANPMEVGQTIPGKPKVSGAKNSYANDTVPATLEEGGIVLPRSVTQAKDAPKKAAEFVAAVMKRQALKK